MWKPAAALAAVAALLLAAPAAHAGGWATVGLSSTPTARTWTVDLTVLQHGRTPMKNIEPAVLVGDRRFPAAPTGRPGVYRAHVVFPSDGRWTYRIEDGFTRVHTYPPAQIGAPAAAAGRSGPDLRLLLPGAALLLAAAALIAIRRPQPQAA
ncbi:MAG TPA: hypothetical protein VNS09_26105 [Solirubrobacter sp.]|nr:hypothetical protein [Solirubrobacter sp.]